MLVRSGRQDRLPNHFAFPRSDLPGVHSAPCVAWQKRASISNRELHLYSVGLCSDTRVSRLYHPLARRLPNEEASAQAGTDHCGSSVPLQIHHFLSVPYRCDRSLEMRGTNHLFAITEKIMPRSAGETIVFAALACTAGISEEFLYRGFAFTAFVRMFVNFGPPNAAAAILSSAWFSLAHLYQGRRGIITTFVVGLIFVLTRIWTGSVVPAVFTHFGIDLVVGIYASRLLRKA